MNIKGIIETLRYDRGMSEYALHDDLCADKDRMRDEVEALDVAIGMLKAFDKMTVNNPCFVCESREGTIRCSDCERHSNFELCGDPRRYQEPLKAMGRDIEK